MPRPISHSASQASDNSHSEVQATQETLFLLSISRDEDDAAALRADLKRSSLGNYKIQHCANLDDALQLLRVCGFDLVFVRLDDFQDKQAAIDLVKRAAVDLTVIALGTSRLLSSPTFVIPNGIDATCRVEDLSPSLVAALVTGALERKRANNRRLRLEQELQLALDAGQLGVWTLHVPSGKVTLDTAAALLLGLPGQPCHIALDDSLAAVYPEDRATFKSAVARTIEKGDNLQLSFRLEGAAMPLPKLELYARFAESGPRQSQQLFGVLKRREVANDLQDRLERASQVVQKALEQRDAALLTANNELLALTETIREKTNIERRSATPSTPNPRESAPAPAADESEASPVDRPAQKEQTPPTAAEPPQIDYRSKRPETSPANDSNLALDRDKQSTFQNVLKSLARRDSEPSQLQDTFPFDFSSDSPSDYSDPDPASEGFASAAKRLVNITQNGHNLRVSLSIEDHAMVEAECEKELLFEILRELLTNVVKHARATDCIISLFRDEDDWVLQVEDDGVGLEKNLVSISSPLNQIGLFRIRTKLALKGGQLDLTPTFPKGLIARARLPVNIIRSHDAEQA